MKAIGSCILFCLLAFQSIGQDGEVLKDLIYNPDLKPEQKVTHRSSIDGEFIYAIDTIDIPFIDDFSTDQFKKYDAQSGDPDVSDTTYILLWDQSITTPEPDSSKYMLDTTYHFVFDSTQFQDSVVFSQTALPDKQITVYDSTGYPLQPSQISVWLRYNIIENIGATTTVDTSYIPNYDLKQDSVTLFFAEANDTALWIDDEAYLNDRYAVNPPTYGVVTFDGLDDLGYPYVDNGPEQSGVADYLTSKPINLANTISDSIYLSFYYQPEGLGNEPETDDSLVLEFWAPDSATWYHIWGVEGGELDSFQLVHIKIEEDHFKQNGFQFRFKNYATLNGNLDHWHIDYVYLDEFRQFDDTLMKDLAFVYPSTGLLREYTAMPWKHFKWNPGSYMKNAMTMPSYNGSNDPKNVDNRNLIIKHDGMVLNNFLDATVLNANALDYTPLNYSVLDAPNNFVFDTSLADTCIHFDVVHALHTPTNPEKLRVNDTVVFDQAFENYYAYDDGTAEKAYGPQSQNSSAQLAYEFDIQQPDTLIGILIHFVPAVEDVSNNTFWLTVWDQSGGKPGNVIHQSSQLPFYKPIYLDGRNSFGFYGFQDGEKVYVDDTYYIGYQQQDPESLNIGFDANNDNSDRIFYNVTGTWQNTSFEGSLLIRPVFASLKDRALDTEEMVKNYQVNIYPNPSRGLFYVEGDKAILNGNYQLFDLSGRVVDSGAVQHQLNFQPMETGSYILQLSSNNGPKVIKKIIIQ